MILQPWRPRLSLRRSAALTGLAVLAWLAPAVPAAFAQTSDAPGRSAPAAQAKSAPSAQAKSNQTASSQAQAPAADTQQQGGSRVAGPTGAFSGLSKNSGQPINIESDVLYVHDAQKYATFKGNVKAVQGTTILHSKELDVHYVGGGSDSLTTGNDASGQGGGAAGSGASAGSASATPVKNTPKAGGGADSAGSAVPAQGAQAAGGNGQANGQTAGGASLGDGGTKITKIYARGDVVITSDQDQTTTGEWAIYDVPAQMITVGGNVVLTQGKNVLKGDRLLIDLTTGESRFENPGSTAGRRIRALFIPKQDANSGDASKDADKDQSGTGKNDGQKSADAKSEDAKSEPKSAGEKPAGAAPPDESSPWQIVPNSPQ